MLAAYEKIRIMKTIEIITTFNDKSYDEYVERYLKSWDTYLDPVINKTLYVDNTNRNYGSNKKILDLEKSNPELVEFKKRNKDYKPKDFRFDAVRFSHKSFSICHAGLNSSADILIWLDSDIYMFNTISKEWLSSFLPKGTFTSYLGRSGKFTETGFLAFDLTNPIKHDFFNKWKWYYNTDFIMQGKQGKTDCHVFDLVRQEFESQNRIKTKNLNVPEQGHAFENVFAPSMSHHKGTGKGQV